KIQWKTNDPVWVEQWPLTAERLKIARQLVQEQLQAGHIKPSISPWNTPIFVIPKKSGKWRLLHDLRKVNDQMWAMDALQPGMPLPTMLPREWHILVIDLKDCFFTIALHSEDTARFAFTVPSINKAEPSARYEWVVLPQGMKNSPTMCQMYVAWALAPLRRQMKTAIIYHYMDDILFCRPEPFTEDILSHITKELANKGLCVAPEKLQRTDPWKYLGWLVYNSTISPQKVELTSSIRTLNDVQRLVGDLQWVRNIVGISNEELQPLMGLLKGTDPAALVPWQAEHQQCLEQLSRKLALAVADRRYAAIPISVVICNQPGKQKKGGQNAVAILEWLFPPSTAPKSVWQRSEAVAHLVQKGRQRCKDVSGEEPAHISLPIKAEDLDWMLQNSTPLQLALLDFSGNIRNYLPHDPRLQVIARQNWMTRPKVVSHPVKGVTAFTDAGKRSRTAACVWQSDGQWQKHLIHGEARDSLQTLELAAVAWALVTWKDHLLNVVSDSQYAVGVVQRIEEALLKPPKNPRLGELFLQICQAIRLRTACCCIIHIRSHLMDLGLA
ncbi:POK11 protein, partial [Fregetta grallaria]|nr:POK11 protein [Fregetta grallaria]